MREWGKCLVFHQQFTLVFDDLLDERHALLHRQTASQSFVVDAAHGRGVDVLIAGGLGQSVVPLLIYGISVGLVVPFAVALMLPFALGGIVQQQRFAMRSGDDDAERVADGLALSMTVEGSRAGVHGRCQHVGLQAQQQFADAGVGPWADVA